MRFVFLSLATAAALSAPAFADFGSIKVWFKGSDQLASASAQLPPGAVAVPAPGVIAVPAGPAPVGVAIPPAVPGMPPTPPLPNPCAVPGACAPSSGKANHYGAGTPNQVVTFLHPYTGKAISIPLTLPMGKPTVIVKADRVIYDYGGCFKPRVVVRFVDDGKVEVKYSH